MLITHIKELIGNTPILKLDPKIHGLKTYDIYIKLEYMNPFGSVKDRVGLALIEPFMEELKAKNKTILEASSANTGKALAALCSIEGLKFKSYTNRVKVPEQRMILQALGSEIEELPGLSDCPDPNDPNDPTKYCEDLVNQGPEKYHYTNQYFNELNPEIHRKTTAKEIYEDLGAVDILVTPLGTCGTSQGTIDYLKEKNPSLKSIGVVSEPGSWVPGNRNLNELWEVGIYKEEKYDEILQDDYMNSIEGAIELLTKAGVFCGPTTGLQYQCIVKKLRFEEENKVKEGIILENSKENKKKVIFIGCDRIEPYLNYIKRYKPEIFSSKTTTRPRVNTQTLDDVSLTNSIKPKELKYLIDSKDENGFIIIDIRGHFAYSIGHIKDSINILDELFATLIEEGPSFPKNKKIVVVCSIGMISRKFASFLSVQGYDASNLEGGIMNWKKEGFEVLKTN